MTVEELELFFRTQFDDAVEPYLVSSEDFLEYLNEAQAEACIRAKLLFDRTSDFCNIPVSTDVQSYEIDEIIYAIVEAFVTDSSDRVTPVLIVDRIELDRLCPDWRQETGLAKYLIQYDDHIEISPKPTEDTTLNVECYLLPIELLTDSDIPQISKVNHRRLLHWVKYRAYDTQDSDVADKSKALEELAMFERIFGIRPNANNIRNHYSNRPHRNKVCL